MPACAGVRRWGAAALDLAYVAAGRYDGYWERGLKPGTWRRGCSSCARRAASSAIGAGDDPLVTGDVLSANAEIFDTFARVIRNV
jgi:myo-inositol-1(or 4)-monophosphatase